MWCRLGEVCDYGKCENIEASELKADDWILDLEDIEKDSGKIITFHSFAERKSESTKHIFRKGDLLYSKLRPYLNKVVIAPKDGFCTSEILPLNFNGVLLNEFAQRLLMSSFFLSIVNMLVYGVKMPRLGRDDAKKIFIPLPPLSEQHRIVVKIETIFAQIDLLAQNKADLQTVVKHTKSKILDLAIRGKLVPQDTADEPASVMLEKLRAEKEAKIAAGEIKRSKNDSHIYKNSTDNCYYQKYTDGGEENISDEIPFDVPEGWAWCRLPEVCRKPITDGTHNSPSNSASGDFLYITAKNIKNLDICLDDATYISKEIHESIYSRCSPELNDILLTKDGTIGEVAVNKLNYPFSMLSSVALIKPSNEILSWFLAYILISDLLQNKMKKDAKGSALKRIILAQINDFLIPLPPLAEQQRIVTKIEELFAQFDFITTTLTK